MSQFIGAFEVTSKLSGETYQCRFSHMWNGIATRHADTIDTKFFVDGEAHVVGLAHTAFVKFRDKAQRDLTDREDRKSTRLNSSHPSISYAVFCLKKKTKNIIQTKKLRNKN